MLKKEIKVVSVAASATKSDIIDLSGRSLVGVQMPSAYTAGYISLENSVDGTNFKAVEDSSGNLVKISTVPTADRYLLLGDINTHGLYYIKLVCENAQAATREFKITTAYDIIG